MNKLLKTIPALLLPVLMTGCFTKPDMTKYKDISTFYGEAEVAYCWYWTREHEGQHYDNEQEYIVLKEIEKIDSFQEIKKFKKPDINYLTYHILQSNSTAGPNFTEMTIYEDGKVLLTDKHALSDYGYLYFSCDVEQALHVIEFANNLIENR